nr:immunoglobulin heavy chain junction region [Macaca mulatta]MOV39494.1 immunoglobulin heavy chain junction region [Macaca mulatta]MOV40012.1 immunoglobulin heavy chain junction region [Macaca mulatta]MOV40761.1 immunoglobulin heavy chain junction region [Macaca mulatta]MOV40817.1 immunoglobulin heavy chain junction region [Macaca mulatta]
CAREREDLQDYYALDSW